jgi:hypothetical protein
MDLEVVARRVASSGTVRTAGKIEFVKDQGPVKRDVRAKGVKWSPDSLRDLAKILWACQRAHSYSMAAFRIFSKMPSSEFSPDGLLGGRGYIQSVKDMRSDLSKAVEILSSFTDTVHDEVNADHWNTVEEDADIVDIMSNVGEVKKNPDEFVESEFQDDVDDDHLVNPPANNPTVDDEEEYDDEYDDDEYDDDEYDDDEYNDVRTSSSYDRYSVAFNNMLMSKVASSKLAGGALSELYVPGMEPTITDRDVGGPRVFPLGPAEGGEFGNFDDPCCQNIPQDAYMYDEYLIDMGLPLPSVLSEGDGDSYRSSLAHSPESYSWLPGSENLKSMNWYGLGITKEDIEWMEKNCKPDMPMGMSPGGPKIDSEYVWDGVRIK